MENLKRYLPWILLGVAVLFLLWLVPAYKKVVTERDSYQNQVTQFNQNSHGVTVMEPVEVAGKVVYKYIYKTETATQSVTQTVTVDHEKKVTIEKRNIVSIGVLWDFKDPLPKALTVDVSVFGPIGIQGQVQRDPVIGLAGVKLSL
jgi:hypothetical protein